MNPIVYNVSLAVGLVLIAVGVALWSVAAALVTTGGLLIALTFASVKVMLMAQSKGGA